MRKFCPSEVLIRGVSVCFQKRRPDNDTRAFDLGTRERTTLEEKNFTRTGGQEISIKLAATSDFCLGGAFGIFPLARVPCWVSTASLSCAVGLGARLYYRHVIMTQ